MPFQLCKHRVGLFSNRVCRYLLDVNANLVYEVLILRLLSNRYIVCSSNHMTNIM